MDFVVVYIQVLLIIVLILDLISDLDLIFFFNVQVLIKKIPSISVIKKYCLKRYGLKTSFEGSLPRAVVESETERERVTGK